MLRNTIILGICIGTSASVPLIYQSNPEAFYALVRSNTDSETVEPQSPVVGAESVPARAAPSLSGRRIHLPVDRSGHFLGDFKLNGRKVEALVDTGASAVAINLSTARRIGLKVRASDMKHSVTTANGKTSATVVMIDRIEIGRVSIENVEALVLEDDALTGTLIGMTFLKRLKKFEADQDGLLLVQ